LRHVHTHTHTHYGLGYPLLPPPPGAVPSVPGVGAPPAHASFPSAGFPGKTNKISVRGVQRQSKNWTSPDLEWSICVLEPNGPDVECH
jgi:hypothetical protein